MAIAFDTSSHATETTGTSLTWSHTCTGTNLCLIVLAGIPTSDTITGVTYNSVAMTQIGKAFVTGNREVYMYALANPASGANNIVISSSSSQLLRGMATSYTGVKPTGLPDSSNTGTNDNASSITLSTTVVAPNCWLVGTMRCTGTTVTAGAGTSVRYQDGGGDAIGDSNGVVGTGSQSLIFDAAAGQNYAGVVASLAPVITSTNYLRNYRRGSSTV